MWLSMCTLTYIFLSKTDNFAISVIKIHGRNHIEIQIIKF